MRISDWSSDVCSSDLLESVIYAGEAHAGFLSGAWTVDETFDVAAAAPEGQTGAVQFCRGWFLVDGTGAGTGRPVAALILDSWLQGRRCAVLLSIPDRFLVDAHPDCSAMGHVL